MKFGLKVKSIALVLSISSVLLSCKKTEEYIPEPYKCDCGQMTWQGSTYDLLDANYVRLIEEEELSRRYYITAEVKSSTESKPHSVNFYIEIPDVTSSIFDLTEDDIEFAAKAEQVNQNDPLLPLRTFEAQSGRVVVSPAFLGGTENVQFSVILQETFNGCNVGGPVSISGNFKVEVSIF